MNINVFQILYSESVRQDIDPGFLLLDNLTNERADWREYFPIRKYLLNTPLDEHTYYGFLSPKFYEKTSISAATLFQFVRESEGCDVVFFSPQIDLQALFLNCFLQGEYFHPGLISASENFFGACGYQVDFQNLIMDSSNTIFSNYFVAKPRFWRAWLDIGEKLFAISEADSPLSSQLNAKTNYDPVNFVQMKVFVMERIASFLLAEQPGWVARAYNPYVISTSNFKPFCENLEAATICDALKIAFRNTGIPSYMERYFDVLKRYGIPNFVSPKSTRF